MRYIHCSEEEPNPCPICAAAVTSDDLKSTLVKSVPGIGEGDRVEMVLLSRHRVSALNCAGDVASLRV